MRQDRASRVPTQAADRRQLHWQMNGEPTRGLPPVALAALVAGRGQAG
jgi:hypothetical protein